MSALVKIQEEIITSPTASVELGGANWDSSYNTYIVTYNNLIVDTDNRYLHLRFLVNNSPDTTSNYHYTYQMISSYTSFNNYSASSNSYVMLGQLIGATSGENANGYIQLFSMNDSTTRSFGIPQGAYVQYGGTNRVDNMQGGFLQNIEQATNGIQIYQNTGSIQSGVFNLYGLKK